MTKAPSPTDPRLTARGARTRDRIVTTAAELMHTHSVGATTLDDVAAGAAVSKSQLYRHFADKPTLVRAVVEHVGHQVIAGERERLRQVRSVPALRTWRNTLIRNNAVHHGRYGCPLGSLANEITELDDAARTQLETLFAAWRSLFADLLQRLRDDNLLPTDTDVDQLATGFVAAIQGGYLLARTARDVAPMAAAIDLMITHLELLGRPVAGDAPTPPTL